MIRIAFTGRFAPSKGIEELLLAVHKIKEAYPGEVLAEFHGYYDARDREALEQTFRGRIKEFQLEPNVRIHGPYDLIHLPQLLKDVDLVILPSRREGFARAPLDAMACGKAVILSAVGGNIDIFKEAQKYGLEIGALIDTGYPDHPRPVEEVASVLAREALRLRGRDGLLKRLGQNARILAEKAFNEKQVSQRWLVTLRQVVAGDPHEKKDMTLFFVAPGSVPYWMRGGGERLFIRMLERMKHWTETGKGTFKGLLWACRENPGQTPQPAFFLEPVLRQEEMLEVPLYDGWKEGGIRLARQEEKPVKDRFLGGLRRLIGTVKQVRLSGNQPEMAREDLFSLCRSYIHSLLSLQEHFQRFPYYSTMYSRPVRELFLKEFPEVDEKQLAPALYPGEGMTPDNLVFNLACLNGPIDFFTPPDLGIALFWGRPYAFLLHPLMKVKSGVPYLVYEGVFLIQTIFEYIDQERHLPESIREFYKKHLVLVYGSIYYYADRILSQTSFNPLKYAEWFGISPGSAGLLPDCIDFRKPPFSTVSSPF